MTSPTETLQQQMMRLFAAGAAEAEIGNLDGAAQLAGAALDAWREAGSPDAPDEGGAL